MKPRTITELEALFRKASEIAQKVPENMQEAAFNRALDILIQGMTTTDDDLINEDDSVKATNTPDEALPSEANYLQTDDILSAIEPAKYPNLTSSSKVLDRSLLILQIAYHDFGVDGLTPGMIAEILTEKFNINTKSTGICNALDLAPSLARRVSDGTRFIYKIMQAGEDHLMNLEQEKRF